MGGHEIEIHTSDESIDSIESSVSHINKIEGLPSGSAYVPSKPRITIQPSRKEENRTRLYITCVAEVAGTEKGKDHRGFVLPTLSPFTPATQATTYRKDS